MDIKADVITCIYRLITDTPDPSKCLATCQTIMSKVKYVGWLCQTPFSLSFHLFFLVRSFSFSILFVWLITSRMLNSSSHPVCVLVLNIFPISLFCQSHQHFTLLLSPSHSLSFQAKLSLVNGFIFPPSSISRTSHLALRLSPSTFSIFIP